MSQSFGDMAFSPKGVIWVLSIFERIRLSRYCAAIRERNSCLYRICKNNIFCCKYMINTVSTVHHTGIVVAKYICLEDEVMHRLCEGTFRSINKVLLLNIAALHYLTICKPIHAYQPKCFQAND